MTAHPNTLWVADGRGQRSRERAEAEAAVARVQDLFTNTELRPVVLTGPVDRASTLTGQA
jgi:hypothetical protein